MDELLGKSLVRSWSEQAYRWTPAARRTFLTGTILFCLGVLLQFAQTFFRPPLFVCATEVVGILESVGLATQIWGIAARYHDSGRPRKDSED